MVLYIGAKQLNDIRNDVLIGTRHFFAVLRIIEHLKLLIPKSRHYIYLFHLVILHFHESIYYKLLYIIRFFSYS